MTGHSSRSAGVVADAMAYAFVAAACLTLAGCSTLDLTEEVGAEAPRCEVHGTVMTPQIIKLSSGEAAYIPEDYRTIAKQHFPHHGGVLLQGERDSIPDVSGRLYYRRVRDFVCPDCDEAHKAWWAPWNAKHRPTE